jgi:hypothetical protein
MSNAQAAMDGITAAHGLRFDLRTHMPSVPAGCVSRPGR